jgi:hypothetical protein
LEVVALSDALSSMVTLLSKAMVVPENVPRRISIVWEFVSATRNTCEIPEIVFKVTKKFGVLHATLPRVVHEVPVAEDA